MKTFWQRFANNPNYLLNDSGWIEINQSNVRVNSKNDHPPPPGQTPGHLTFLKMPDQIPLYMGRFLGQMPHWLGLKSHRVGFFFCIR